MGWSREDVFALRMGAFWGDTAEEIAHVLSRDLADVLAEASRLGLALNRLRDLTGKTETQGETQDVA